MNYLQNKKTVYTRCRIYPGLRSVSLAMMLFVWAMVSAISPQEAVSRFSTAPRLPQNSMSVLVSELPSGKILASYNADLSLTPASIMKCISLASLSEIQDVDMQIDTPVYIDGNVDSEGVLHGNILVVGRGDPSLNSKVGPEAGDILDEIANALQASGIKRIEGSIIVDDSFLAGPSIPSSWASGDLPHSYGTGSHSFNYSNNSIGKSAVRDPAAAFKSDLRSRLLAKGITVEGADIARGDRESLVVHSSAPIKEILRSCMMRSDNLFAETSLRLFGKGNEGDGSTADAARRETKFWKDRGVSFDGVNIVDGSGLSRANKLTARFMENILRKKSDDVEYVSFFPLAGQEGTLKKFLAGTPLDSYIALKTGSMNGIQCYAGYKLDDNFAPTHVAVVMVNDFRCDRGYLRGEVEKMLLEIFSDENMTDKTLTNPRKTIQDYAE